MKKNNVNLLTGLVLSIILLGIISAATTFITTRIYRDLTFDFQARAQGIELSGKGLLGPMAATVDSFQGNISWKLDDKFFASPLKNLKASGQVKLSQGRIGEQYFDLAQGKLSMGQGLVSIDQVIFGQGRSILQASGQTGLGYPTDLRIRGSKIDLNDLIDPT